MCVHVGARFILLYYYVCFLFCVLFYFIIMFVSYFCYLVVIFDFLVSSVYLENGSPCVSWFLFDVRQFVIDFLHTIQTLSLSSFIQFKSYFM
jgi:hypothetical protein